VSHDISSNRLRNCNYRYNSIALNYDVEAELKEENLNNLS